jgi:hypothetical protein
LYYHTSMEFPLDEHYAPEVLTMARISPKRLDQTRELINEFFDDEWMQYLKELYQEKGYKAFKHPLYSGLIQGEVSVVTPIVVELATCLNRLRGKPGLKKTIDEFKDPERFNEPFFHLTTAYRLSFADDNVQLEPKINGKTPDCSFEFMDVKCVAECTAMSGSSTYERFHDRMQYLSTFVMGEAERRSCSCNIYLDVSHESITQKADEVEEGITTLFDTNTIPSTVDVGFCEISILPPEDKPDAELAMIQHIMTAEEFVEWREKDMPSRKGEYTAGFFVTYKKISESMHKNLEDRIYEKIMYKVEKVRPLVEEYEVILFIDTDVSQRQLHEKDEEIAKEITENILNNEQIPFQSIVLTNRPRGELGMFAINRSQFRCSLGLQDEWWEAFWHEYMRPAAYHNFTLKLGANTPCPCECGLKYKKCHGYFDR